MRITIKTLQQAQFPLEIEATESVKQKIQQCSESKNIPVECQKLIHAGKVLENDQIVSSTVMKEGDFVVLMTVKPKVISASTTNPARIATTEGEAKQKSPTGQPSSSPKQAEGGLSPSLSTTATSTIAAESALLTGNAYEEAISRLVDMGFGREEAMAAMRASFNNPDRAVEYLTTGVLPTMTEEGGAGTLATGAAAASGGDALEFLRHDPQFRQLRTLIQQNPHMLGPIVEQLGQSSPELLQLIDQNREEFYGLLMETAAVEGEGEGEGEGEEIIMGDAGEEDEDEDQDQDGEGEIQGRTNPHPNIPADAQILQVSPEERAAIERLEAMGFGRARAVEAFFVCDKNEELAANYLIEHMNDQD